MANLKLVYIVSNKFYVNGIHKLHMVEGNVLEAGSKDRQLVKLRLSW